MFLPLVDGVSEFAEDRKAGYCPLPILLGILESHCGFRLAADDGPYGFDPNVAHVAFPMPWRWRDAS